MVDADTINTFKSHLDKLWLDQDVVCNFLSELTGTGGAWICMWCLKKQGKRNTCTRLFTLDLIGVFARWNIADQVARESLFSRQPEQTSKLSWNCSFDIIILYNISDTCHLWRLAWLSLLVWICVERRKGFVVPADFTVQCHDRGVPAGWRERGDYNPGIWQCSGLN